MMVPYPAGAASDFTARALNDLVGKALGGQVIVENLGGASGAIAAGKVLAAPARCITCSASSSRNARARLPRTCPTRAARPSCRT